MTTKVFIVRYVHQARLSCSSKPLVEPYDSSPPSDCVYTRNKYYYYLFGYSPNPLVYDKTKKYLSIIDIIMLTRLRRK